MNALQTRIPTGHRLAAALASLCLFPLASLMAADAPRDYWSIIAPVTVPKAGVGQPPANAPAGNIKIAYETTFENYWIENTYFEYDPQTGTKLNGFFTDTMTRGYYHQPWPINSRVGSPAAYTRFTTTPWTGAPRGIGEPVSDTLALFHKTSSSNASELGFPLVDAGPFGEPVWTPGESFQDANNNCVWDGPVPADDRWEIDNPIRIPTNSCGELIASGWANHETASGPWDPLKGELFADYGGTRTDLAGGIVGYDPQVTIYIANQTLGYNIPLSINELDLTPTLNCTNSNEGDKRHTWVPGSGPANPANDVPLNNVFDYTVTTSFQPQVAAALNSFNGQPLRVSYRSYVRKVDGTPYLLATPVSPTNTTIVVTTILVNVYQTSELFGDFLANDFDGGNLRAKIYGEFPPGGGNDGVWTAGQPGELFEDFISWWDPFGGPEGNGGMTYVIDIPISSPFSVTGSAGHPSRNTGIFLSEYEDYINWNYLGDAAALIARAGNGRFDGPDAWTNRGSNKYRQSANDPALSTPPPFQWVTTYQGSWSQWWLQAFGTNAPAWKVGIPNISRFTGSPASCGGSAGWVPATPLDYDGPREFIDLASSLYHLGGLPLNALGPAGGGSIHPLTGMWGADGWLGEATSPHSENLFGLDTGTGNPSSPAGPDGSIPSAGPWAFNIDGNHGFEAGNMLNIELLTRRFDPAEGSSLVPGGLPYARDGNLDGMIDLGESRAGEGCYNASNWDGSTSTLGGGMGPYPFNRDRFAEDTLESIDHIQDFKDFKISEANPAIAGLYLYTIYPSGGNAGWGALGGPAGATFNVLTRDRPQPFAGFFQARPFSGSGIGGTTNNVAIGTYAMGILAHEMGHDVHGLPDLYDYDVWNGGPNPVINWPIGGYDLMSNAALVHMIPDMKRPNWTSKVTLETMLSTNNLCSGSVGPVVVEMYPVEDFKDNYFQFGRIANQSSPNGSSGPNEYFSIWFKHGQSPFSQPGPAGLMISHTDLGIADGNGLPAQQRSNGHFTWRLIQGDGLQELEDGVNLSDGGDMFPGSTPQYVFSADTIPSARWYSEQDSGLRILDIRLPSQVGQPALVTMEWLCITEPWVTPKVGADSDNDGLIDAWEWHYYGGLGLATSQSDLDTDGLTDYYEWLAELSPTDPFSGDPYNQVVSDADHDMEPDGLSNIEEQAWGTHPLDPDSDDDSFPDGQEVNSQQLSGDRRISDPLNSRSPLIHRSLCLLGTGYSVPEPVFPGTVSRFELTQFTVEAWIRVDSANQTGSFIRRDTLNNRVNFDLRLVNGVPQFGFTNSAGTPYYVTSATAIPANTWIHLAGVYDPARRALELYRNGVIISERILIAVIPATGRQSAVGSNLLSGEVFLGTGLTGYMDEVRIWNRPLDDQELLDNHTRIIDTPWVSGPGLGLLANYRFDDGENFDPLEADGAEDFVNILDWAYSIPNACFSLQAPILVGDGIAGAAWDDQNGDTLPDWWQSVYFDDFNPTNICSVSGPRWCPDQDPDLDGLSNLAEYQGDTNPLNGQNEVLNNLPPPGAIVASILSTNGLYGRCESLVVRLAFPSPVQVFGNPAIRMNSNIGTALALYQGQVSPNILEFLYTIGSGETSADLDYSGINALEPNGGFIFVAGTFTQVSYILQPVGSPGSISFNQNIQVDGNQERLFNGMPACWLATYFPGVNPATVNPLADPDLDGVNNLDESIANTDPNTAELIFTSITPVGADMSLEWSAIPGFVYDLEVKDPPALDYVPLTTLVYSGNPMTYLDVNPPVARLYRVLRRVP